jgi:hypothetical protein
MVRKHFLLPKPLVERFERAVGARKQSERIASLIEADLRRVEAKRAFEDLANSPKSDHPEWEGPGAISKWVRNSRSAWGAPVEPRE